MKSRFENFCLIFVRGEPYRTRETVLTNYVEQTSKCATRMVTEEEHKTGVYGEDLWESLLKSKYLKMKEG